MPARNFNLVPWVFHLNEVDGTSTYGLNANCTNTQGSYRCQCTDGYHGDGINCYDDDVCSNGPCHQKAVCSNTKGSYNCRCNFGYHGNGIHVLIEMSAHSWKTTYVTRKQGVSTMRGHINTFVTKDITETAGTVKVYKTFQIILPFEITASFLY